MVLEEAGWRCTLEMHKAEEQEKKKHGVLPLCYVAYKYKTKKMYKKEMQRCKSAVAAWVHWAFRQETDDMQRT